MHAPVRYREWHIFEGRLCGLAREPASALQLPWWFSCNFVNWPGENVRDLHHTPSPENGRQNWSGGGKCLSEKLRSVSRPRRLTGVRFRTEHPTIAQSRWNGRGLERANTLIPLWLPSHRAGGLFAN